MPEENFWTLWCKGRLTEADTPTIRMGATPSGLSSQDEYKLLVKSVKMSLLWLSVVCACNISTGFCKSFIKIIENVKYWPPNIGLHLFVEITQTLYLFILNIVMATLWNRAGHYIFALWFLSSFFLSSFFVSSPNLSCRRLDVYHTSAHGVALVRI